jgi:tetratricopeptide (TPR) repeat protein
MKEQRLKYIFYLLSVILLISMLVTSKNAGISCDEVLHYNHSVSVYNYFASHGADKSALNTPETNLKYYGQSYDNIVTFIAKWFKINDVYAFRHIMSSIAGWLAIMITALFAVWLTDKRAGLIVLVLFAFSPTFMGHSQNNLKDIPFALGYIAGIYYILRLFVDGKNKLFRNLIILTAIIAFAISIRAGGLILICYSFFFLLVIFSFRYLTNGRTDALENIKIFLWLCCMSLVACVLSILLWPFALQSPVKNIIESYRVMAHFPSTFRQIFEGRVEWSDYMPWYYLPKSMLITIPLLVTSGLILFFIFSIRKLKSEKLLSAGLLVFTIVFPLVFVVLEKSNVYSSWRQFLFIYPGIVLASATGFVFFYDFLRPVYLRVALIIACLLLVLHPAKYMLNNPGYFYLYYNQLAGGLRGAYSQYETDYYYQGQTEAAAWLVKYLGNESPGKEVKVLSNYSLDWQFRSHPEIKTFYSRNEERSQSDWDYAIETSRYITPYQLKNKIWPPADALHTIYADNIPICVIVKRKTKADLAGFKALNDGKYKEALADYKNALEIVNDDELIFFNFAAALIGDGQVQNADSVLKRGLRVNPDSELILMYLGNLARSGGRDAEAINYYKKVIDVNRKYFEAYVGLAQLMMKGDVSMAREVLKTCLMINPGYKPAITALADTYRQTDPEIARKYDELAASIN